MDTIGLLNKKYWRFSSIRDLYEKQLWKALLHVGTPWFIRSISLSCRYDPFLTKEFPCPECKLDINPKYNYLLQEYLNTLDKGLQEEQV